MNPRKFKPIRTALVPICSDCDNRAAVTAARWMADEVILVGLVKVEDEAALSRATLEARKVRRQMEGLRGEGVRVRVRVRVSPNPWAELQNVVTVEKPDLLVFKAQFLLDELGVTLNEVLAHPPCDMALVHGNLQSPPLRVLVPVRGGPYAELALRVGLSLHSKQLTALHLHYPDQTNTDAPFRGLKQVLQRMPEVETREAATSDPAQTILDESKNADVIVIGSTARRDANATLGTVADRLLHASSAPVIVVQTRRSMPAAQFDESAGAQAISILVDKWFAENTFHAHEFTDMDRMLALKREQKVTISLALPALNEELTVGKVIRTVKTALMDDAPLLDEIVLIDSDSTDRTREIAGEFGLPVYIHQQILPKLGARPGKGEALWKSLLVTKGDILVWIDTDIVNINPAFVYGILGPLLLMPHIQFVKGFYRRPLKVGEKTQAGGGGRVTELTARPLLNLFYPELSGVLQPLSGEYGGRRRALEQLPFFSGYGVETGLLIDIFEKYGLNAIAQVDLMERVHHNQPLEALSKMSFAILQAVIRKLESRLNRPLLEEVNKSMKLIRYKDGNYSLDVEDIIERERPPMIEIPEYQEKLNASRGA